MATILFSFRDKDTIDDRKDHRRGDPLVAMPTRHVWGAGEDKRQHLAKFGDVTGWVNTTFLLNIRGLPLTRARKFLEPHYRPATAVEPEFNAPDPEDRVVLVRRKRWGLIWSELPRSLKRELRDVGYASVSLQQIRPYFRHRFDNSRRVS